MSASFGKLSSFSKMHIQFFCLICWSSMILFVAGNELARGFNDDINWVTFEEGKKLSQEINKPMMLLIHKTWCGACKALKPQFATSLEIQELSKEFVMVNLQDDEEPTEPLYSPDGMYIPRVLFIAPSGNVLTDIVNQKGNPSYKYFYYSTPDIVDSMKQVQSMRDKGSIDEL